jgi:hypothetical protein
MSDSDVGFGPFNIIAAFASEHDSGVAVDVMAARFPGLAVVVDRPGQESAAEVAELEAEMQDELDESWAGLPRWQVRRALTGAVVLGAAGVALGLVIGLGWAYLVASGLSRLVRILIVGGLGGLAGATVGFVDGGGGLPRGVGDREAEEQPAAERDVLVSVRAEDPATAERAAIILRELGAERVHLVDVHGVPLPPQAQHPRPADPEGWWWKDAGKG